MSNLQTFGCANCLDAQYAKFVLSIIIRLVTPLNTFL